MEPKLNPYQQEAKNTGLELLSCITTCALAFACGQCDKAHNSLVSVGSRTTTNFPGNTKTGENRRGQKIAEITQGVLSMHHHGGNDNTHILGYGLE